MVAVVATTAVVTGAGVTTAAAAGNGLTLSGVSHSPTIGPYLFAKNGSVLGAAVTTNASRCVVLTDTNGLATQQTLPSGFAQTAWSFQFTTGLGDGLETVTATGFSNVNAQNKCSNSTGSYTATYVLDNTGPTISPVLTPAANSAGWNSSNTSVAWTATDPAADAGTSTPGSGVATQPIGSTSYNQNGIYNLTAPAVSDRLGNAGTGSGTLRLDKAAPTISGSRTPAANGFGWNNTSVVAHFTCNDNPATDASGLASPGCPADTTVSTDGSAQSVSGSVSDVAGNSASATVNNISIDTAKPSLSGTPTTSPNGNGWYNGNVSVHWTSSDPLSGIDPATVPADSTISSEGSQLSASASVSDKAGNTTSATSPKVNIDKTAPTTGVTGASNNWTNGNVTLTLAPTDALSGVASTTYTVDGGSPQQGTSVTVSTEGDHTISYFSTDKAGNAESAKTAHVKIDKTAPTIGHAYLPAGYTDGSWTNASKVTVSFTCSDSGAGVGSCTSPVDVTAEGSTTVHGTATDNAGNSATDNPTVNIDRTPPTISAGADRSANGNGWYDANVIVSYLCGDQANLSGIASCPGSQTIGEGSNQTASGTAHDVAGNTASASVTGINVDKTAPGVTGAATTSPNANGWYDNSVVVHWTCTDALSGVPGAACPANSTVSGEGSNLGATATATDRAGNTGTGAVSGIKIDTTPPVTLASASAPLATGWYADHAHVTLTPGDNLSNVDRTYYSVDSAAPSTYTGPFDFSTPGVHTISFWSVDGAGNTEDVTAPGHTLTLKVDNIAPSISGSRTPAANAFGWNNSNVTVSFDCADSESGVANCLGGTVLSDEGGDQSVTGTATDNGGNSAQATVSGVNIDKTAPSLSGAPTTPPNSHGWYDGDVAVHWTASDDGSGIDGSTLPSDTPVTGEGSNLAAGPVSVSDLAGNTASAGYANIKIDRTAPTITGEPTTPPNENGWYSDDISVAWTCSDLLSGIATGDCPDNSTVTGEGDDLGASASTTDKAGNTAPGSVSGLKIDRTAPTTGISAPSDWQNHAVTIELDPTDNLSQVAATHYTVDGGDTQTGTEIPFTAEGTYDVEVWSVDNAGNAETHQSFEVKLDLSKPTITHTLDPAPNAAGWNNSDVTVTFQCNDTGGSGIASCTDPITEPGEGVGQPEPGTATDNAGNSTIDPATVSIDKSDPTVSAAPDRAPDANGWYNHAVTYTFSCADQVGLSGIADCSSQVTLAEGGNQSVTGHALDAAGNTASTKVSGVDVDETAPTLSGAATTAPNGNGWYKDDVTVHWTCSDALSGIPTSGCPADDTVTGEGDDLGASTSVSDVAGNSTPASVTGLQIDRTPPVTTVSVPTPTSDNGWYAAGPTVTLTPTDSLSTVGSTYYSVDGGTAQPYTGAFVEGLEGVHTVTFWSKDLAGNVESRSGAGNSVTIRVDSTDPTISGSRTPAANPAGWNNEPVVATFSCDDSGSGIDSCTDPVTVSTEGDNQSATGTAFDTVGNSSTTTVKGIRIDLTNPTLSGAATTSPNAAGWYTGNVSVHWTCGDALSGIAGDGSCPADSTVTGEGSDLSVSTSVHDKAGNVNSASVDHINIDRTAPVTTVSAPSDWQRAGVTLDVTATDGGSGVKATHYTVNAGATQTGNQIALPNDGVYTLAFWSVDNAGNVEDHGAATVEIDQTAPSISHSITPEPNAAGWDRANTTVHFICGDATSGVAACTGDQVVSTEGLGQKVSGTATDVAGNSSGDTATVNLDKTPPTIHGHADRTPNNNGWYNADVTVSFTCDDLLSGAVGCPSDTTLGEGNAQSVKGTVSDAAGNSASDTVLGLNIDKGAPTLSGAPTTASNGQGWYAGDVTVHWTCDDKLSGLPASGGCPADSTVTGEGTNLSVTRAINDKAGNGTTAAVNGINIDRTAPVTTASAPDPTYASGWYGGPVTVTLSASDNLSTVASTLYSVDGGQATSYSGAFQVSKGQHTVTFWSRDKAGNVEDKTAAGHSLTLKVDDVAPTISGAPTTSANANGWYNGPVTVHFTCSDAESSIDPNGGCPADQTVSADGAGQSVTGTAKDVAGNSSQFKVGGINIDSKAPTFPAYTGGTTFKVGQTLPTPSCSATDSLSGIASCTTVRTGSGFTNANGVGDFTYNFTALDKAGNSSTSSVTLHVGYGWSGFLTPVTNTAHDLGSASAFKAGSTVPMKFQLTNASGAVLQASYAPVWMQPVDGGTTSTTATADSLVTPGTVGGSYKWDPTAQQFVFTWQTPKTGAGHYYRVGVTLDSGDSYSTLIVLK